jgi:DNA-binding HxlR family transcriptional regulator
LLVVRELRLGARRYADLQASLPGLGPSVLSQRLRDLEQVGVLERRILPPPVAAQVYELTEWGAELEPVFAALASWGVRSPVVPLEGDLSEDAVMLGLRTFFVAGDPDWDATYEVRLERETYTIVVAGGGLDELTRGQRTGPVDATVDADRFAMRSLLTRATSLSAAVDSGQVTVTGDIRAAQRLFDAV